MSAVTLSPLRGWPASLIPLQYLPHIINHRHTHRRQVMRSTRVVIRVAWVRRILGECFREEEEIGRHDQCIAEWDVAGDMEEGLIAAVDGGG